MQESGQLHALSTLCPKETAPDSHYIEGWEGTTASWMLKKQKEVNHHSLVVQSIA